MKIDLIPFGILFTFDVKTGSNYEKVRFCKKLYGYVDYSRGHKYQRPGLLTNLKHLRPTRSTIILTLKDAGLLRKFFRKNKVKFSENVVVLHHAQARKLGVESPNKWLNIYRDILGKEDLIWSVDV